VRGISFQVDVGSVVGFLGPNGAGKTTTLRILAGFLGATAGSVRISGHDVASERLAALAKLGYMPETSPLYPELRVHEYLRFRAELKGLARRRRGAEVDRVLELARVTEMEDVIIAHLSKGYRQRVGLADALLGSPPLLILDEPTAGLDPNQIREVRALIRSLAEQHTILLSTHILPEVEVTCERALVISRGKLVASGRLDELRGQSAAQAVEVVVAGSGKTAKSVLRQLKAVRAVQISQKDGAAQLTVRFHKRAIRVGERLEHGPATEKVVAALVGAGVGVRRVQPVGASLEQVFAQLTEDPP